MSESITLLKAGLSSTHTSSLRRPPGTLARVLGLAVTLWKQRYAPSPKQRIQMVPPLQEPLPLHRHCVIRAPAASGAIRLSAVRRPWLVPACSPFHAAQHAAEGSACLLAHRRALIRRRVL
jgi:hypothetical protein